MKMDKIREMTQSELLDKEKELKTQLFNLRFQNVTGQLDNPLQLNTVRKDIARVKTVLKEMEMKKAQG